MFLIFCFTFLILGCKIDYGRRDKLCEFSLLQLAANYHELAYIKANKTPFPSEIGLRKKNIVLTKPSGRDEKK